jgi:hypothetical protein
MEGSFSARLAIANRLAIADRLAVAAYGDDL